MTNRVACTCEPRTFLACEATPSIACAQGRSSVSILCPCAFGADGGKTRSTTPGEWKRFEPDEGRIVIVNFRTDHFLNLYRAHIREIRDGKPGEGLLVLTVQVVFEDGHARLERLPPNAVSISTESQYAPRE